MSLASPRLERPGPLSLSGILRRHNREQKTYDIVHAIGRQWAEYMTRCVAPPWSPLAWRYGVTLRMAAGDKAIAYFLRCSVRKRDKPRIESIFRKSCRRPGKSAANVWTNASGSGSFRFHEHDTQR
jgi:hypothetical protein